MAELLSKLAAIRKSRGMRAAALAEAVGVNRQTIYAMESGNYLPNTAVALRLARALGVRVEELFTLDEDASAAKAPVDATLLQQAVDGDPLRLCAVGDRLMAVPALPAPEFLPDADAILRTHRGSRARVELLAGHAPSDRRLLVAGCDPALAFLVSAAADSGLAVTAVPASSRTALSWLRQGLVHVAGSHLEDLRSGEFNLPFVRKQFGEGHAAVVTFARWEEGWVVRQGNPKSIRRAEDLARKNVRLRNRDLGSGARSLLDRMLQQAGVEPNHVNGYNSAAAGHLSAARDVALGVADCCIATHAAARAFHLDFVPVKAERYDFVFPREALQSAAIQLFLEVLQRATLRQKLRSLAGYDVSETGTLLAQ